MNKNGMKDFVSSFLVAYAVSYATTKIVQNAQNAKNTQKANTSKKNTRAHSDIKELLAAYNAVRDK